LLEDIRTSTLDLAQERAGGAEETKDHDPARLPVSTLMVGVGIMLVIEIAEPDPLQGTDQAARDLIAARHHERTHDRQHNEGKRRGARRLGADMAGSDTGLDHDQRELGY